MSERRAPLLSILSILSVLVAAGPAAAEELRAVPHPAAHDEVPEGSRDDQLLWKAARDATVEAMRQIALVNQALYELRYARLDLDQLGTEAARAEDTAKLRALRARLDEPAAALEAVVPRGPSGRCRYVLLHLEQSMGAEPGTDAAKRLPDERAAARACEQEMARVAD
ncbi:MAG TPA: hypothetical protein VFP65_23305, partial [Anaeromyxobacteraceae bacterium]|nr:hypothetical protein [Anaeromyxobacteraceae bacterium]